MIDKGIRASEGSRGKLNIEQAGIHVFSQTNLGEDEMHHRSLTENDRFGFFLMLAGTVPLDPTPLSLLSTADSASSINPSRLRGTHVGVNFDAGGSAITVTDRPTRGFRSSTPHHNVAA